MYRALVLIFPRDIAAYILTFREVSAAEEEKLMQERSNMIKSLDPRSREVIEFCGKDIYAQRDNECNWIQYARYLGTPGFVKVCAFSRVVIEMVFLEEVFEDTDYNHVYYEYSKCKVRPGEIRRVSAKIARFLGSQWLNQYIAYRKGVDAFE